MKKLFTICAMAAVAACSATPERYAVTAPVVTDSQRIAFRAVEVRDVSLPAYAAADEITLLDETGRLTSDTAVLWADQPERAIAFGNQPPFWPGCRARAWRLSRGHSKPFPMRDWTYGLKA